MKTLTALALLASSSSVWASETDPQGTDPTPIKTWLVLDDLAYHVYESIGINPSTHEVIAVNNNISNCLQENNSPPLNSGTFTLVTDTQDIGLTGDIVFDPGRSALLLSSQTQDLICQGAFEFDRIYINGYE